MRQQRIHRIISRHMRSHRFRQTGGSRSLASQRLIEQLKSPSKHPCDSQQLHAATMTDATHPTTEPLKFFPPIPFPTHVSPIFTFPSRLLPLSLTSLYSSRYVSKYSGLRLGSTQRVSTRQSLGRGPRQEGSRENRVSFHRQLKTANLWNTITARGNEGPTAQKRVARRRYTRIRRGTRSTTKGP